MKLNCEAGKMAMMVKALLPENQGKTFTTIRLATDADCRPFGYYSPADDPVWLIDRLMPTVKGNLHPFAYDRQLRKINGDQPGNEQFVTELRNKLPRSKPATTKGDTINERGELA